MLKVYMTDDITIKTITYDQWGSPSTSSATAKGRFEFKTKLVRNIAGEQVVSSANVMLPADTVIGHQDKITYVGKDYSILTIELKKDFSNRFLLIYLT
jgi:hypothetical protein